MKQWLCQTTYHRLFMRAMLAAGLCWLLFPSARPLQAQPGTINGQFNILTNDGATLIVEVQLNATGGTDRNDMGTSTFQVTFNNNALTFNSADFQNYSGNQADGLIFYEYNLDDDPNPSHPDALTMPAPNTISLNVFYAGCTDFSGGPPGTSCAPTGQLIPTAFTTFVTLTFAMTDNTQLSGLGWGTIQPFNSTSPAGSNAFNEGTFSGLDVLLPVELSAFEAVADGKGALLTWQTASETNNAGFEVEWAGGNSGVWTRLAFVEGAGTTTEAQRYQYRAEGLEIGTYRFRLKQIDYDGAFEYSPEVEVTVELAERFVLEGAYPNPFNPQTTIRFAVLQAGPVQVALYDALGRRVQVLYQGVPEAGQMQAVQIDGGGLSSGMYFVRLAGEGIAATRRVMLVK